MPQPISSYSQDVFQCILISFVACNTVYTGLNEGYNMLHEIEVFPISCNMLHAPLTPV